MSSASSSTPGSSYKPNGPSADDIEKLLNREATAFQREMEVERILKAFKLKYVPLPASHAHTHRPHLLLPTSCIFSSPYEILDLGEEATTEDIKKKYRQLSLCEHPTEPARPYERGT